MLTTLFILSGLGIAVLLLAKRIEEKKKRDVFLLNLISKGDIHVRELHHGAVRFYSVSKEKTVFFVKKQLPMRSRSTVNKAVAKIEEMLARHFEGMRGSKLLKKSEGISEFFKNIGEVKRGEGELVGEIYMEEEEIETVPVAAEEIAVPEIELEPLETAHEEPKEPVVELIRFDVEGVEADRPKAKRARKSLVGKKLKVVAQVETEERL